MENLKIIIGKSKSVAEEARKLFKELGYYVSEELYANCYGWIISVCEGEYTRDIEYFNKHQAKLVTVDQLRDLVVLNRNDVSDKTHYCDTTNSDYFVSSDNVVYFFNDEKNNTWQKSNYDLSELKPIEKEMREYSEVKEYLDPNDNYSYHKVPIIAQGSNWIEVPDGMNFAYKDEFNIHFTKLEMGYRDSIIIWQRHTQHEELPFIDNEPKCDNPLLIQVGGNHYKNLAIQPVEFAMKNNLDYCQANAIKYIVRHANKNGKQDLEKAKHYIDLLIQNYYSEDI